MKKPLLFIGLISSFTFFGQTNLVLNGTGDEFTNTVSDNADAWDMTPTSTVVDNSGATIDSPYFALWNNSTLDTWLKDTYNSGGDVDEQPGSTDAGTYNGATQTRALKLYGDGSPAVSASTRRLYQKITVEAGATYTFSIESRSEAENIPSEIFMLNEEITSETGLEKGAADSRVDHYLNVTNDYNSSKGGEGNNTFTTSTFDFTATTTTVVIYVRALLANDGATEVFYDNISLVKKVETAAGNTVTPLTAEFDKGYINAFNVSNDAYAFGFPYGVADMKTTIAASSVTLQPNFKIFVDEAANTAWFNNGAAVVYIEGSSFAEPSGLNDSDLTFEGNVSAFSIDSGYKVVAFIKALDPNNGYTTVTNESTELTATGDFSVSATAAQLAAGMLIQYGFSVTGVPADPANESALGSVVVGEKATASIDDVLFDGLKVYPNPASSVLNISADTSMDSATIHNLLGQQVKNITINANKISLDVSDLNSGIYLVKITSGSKQISKKFIKR